MGTWRGTGRRVLAVGAGTLLIGALGAGPAFAESNGDDDDGYNYVDDNCGDYRYSWYFEHGYDYDKHWDDRWDHDWDKDHRWDKDHDRWKDHDRDDKDRPVKPPVKYDPITGFPIDPITGLPIDPITKLPIPKLPISSLPDPKIPDPVTTLGTGDTDSGDAKPGTVEEPPSSVNKTPPSSTDDTESPSSGADDSPASNNSDTEAPTSSGNDAPASSDSPTVSTPVDEKAVVTSLAAGDPKDDDKDWNKDRDRDRDWNKDRDHDGDWWGGWWERDTYRVVVKCYEDKEKKHRWYDDRPVGKVEATKVRTVPKGGVDTGN